MEIQEKVQGARRDKSVGDLSAQKSRTFITLDQRVQPQKERLAQYVGQEFIGIPQKRIKSLDALLLGFRKFNILAGAPNTGKTALTIQFGLDAVANNSDVCLLYVSFEMSAQDIEDRIKCHFAKMTYKKLYFGEKHENITGYFTQEELNRITEAEKEMLELGPRILIIEPTEDEPMTADVIFQYTKDLKNKTECKKVIVIIDYLQVMPAPEIIQNENEIGKYQIEEMKRLRAKLINDPLIVIAEARKPNSSSRWLAGSQADILGTSRTAYGNDCAMLLNQLSVEEIVPSLTHIDKIFDQNNNDLVSKIEENLNKKGISILSLKIDKGRDGMERGVILLKFHFRENRFDETSLYGIANLFKELVPEMPSPAQQINKQNKKGNQKASKLQVDKGWDA